MREHSLFLELSQLQVSHTITALKEYAGRLLSDTESEDLGGAHEDLLIIQSVIDEIASKKRDVGSSE